MPRLPVVNGILRRRGMPRLYRGVGHGRQRSVGHQHLLPTGLQTLVAVEPEEAFVALAEEVGLGQVEAQREPLHAHAQHIAQRARQRHYPLEQQPVGLLLGRARIAHTARTRPQAPLPAPLIADDRAHRATVGIVDSITLLCHNDVFFKR